MTLATVIGFAAAVCTTLANLPQLIKAWTTRETDDLSLKTLFLLGTGLVLWVVYGVVLKDIVLILANAVSLMLVIALVFIKLFMS